VIEYREVPVTKVVIEHVPLELTADCPPDYKLPAEGALTFDDVIARLESVETANTDCRRKLAIIRQRYSPPADNP